MANQVKLPRLGQGMEAGTVTKWLKAEGETVEKGEPLYEIDTDKVTQEVESDFAGVLLKIALEAGEAPVGQTIAWIGEAGEEIADAPAPQRRGARQSKARAEPRRQTDKVSDTAVSERRPLPLRANGARIKASPLARRIARERGIELSSLRGTGPEGRIVAEDVERAQAAAAPGQAVPAAVPSGEVESIPLTSIRKTIARRLTAAWQAPAFQLTVSADMTRTNALVAKAARVEPRRADHRHRRAGEGRARRR